MYDLKDDPVIRCMERTGSPPREDVEEQTVCPVCGEECETAYYNRYGAWRAAIAACTAAIPARTIASCPGRWRRFMRGEQTDRIIMAWVIYIVYRKPTPLQSYIVNGLKMRFCTRGGVSYQNVVVHDAVI